MDKVKKSHAFDNLGMKALALIVAFILWIVVMNVTDFMTTKTIRNIPVTKINGDKLDEMGMVYDVTGGDTVDVIVKGPRSIVESLTSSDFTAVADLSKMSVTNTVQILVKAVGSIDTSRITVTTVDDMLSLSIEEKTSVDVPVKIVTTGSVNEQYALGTCTVTPNIIRIEGPESVVKRVTELRAVVSLANRSETFEVVVEPSCFDAYGEAMTGKNITLGVEEVKVTLPINPVKEVPVVVTSRGTVAEGYGAREIIYNPQSVLIAGEASLLNEISSIRISDISVDGITESLEKNIDIEDYLPTDIYLADTNNEVAVSIPVEKLETKTISVQSTDIELLGTNDSLIYSVLLPTGYSVSVTGLPEVVEELNVARLSPKLDVSKQGVGTYLLSVDYLTLDEYEVKNNLKVTLNVKAKADTGSEKKDSEKNTSSESEEDETEKTTE